MPRAAVFRKSRKEAHQIAENLLGDSGLACSLLGQIESREGLGYALDYVVEPVLPGVGFGVVDESVGEAGLTVLIGEDEGKLILFGRGEPDGLRWCRCLGD